MKGRAMTPRHLSQTGKGENGFTFVEIMIALAVGAIVIAGMYQGFNTLHKWWISSGIRSDMRQNARAGLETVTRDLEMAGYQTTNYGDVNKTGLAITLAGTNEIEMDQQQPDSATIGTANPVYEPRIVYYHLATDMKSGRQHLYRQIRSRPGLPAPDEIVAENVSAFVLGYLDRDNNKFKGPGDPDNPADLPNPPYLPGTQYATAPPLPAQYSFGSPPPAVLKNIRRIQVTLTTIPARAVPFGPAPKPFTLMASVMPQNMNAADEATAGCKPPSVPTGLAVIDNRSCSGGIQVKWNPVTDQNLGGYILFYGPTNSILVPASKVQVTLQESDLLITRHADRLTAPNTYTIQVQAYAATDRECRSEKSAAIAANPAADVDSFGGGNDTTVNPAKARPPTNGVTGLPELTVTPAAGGLDLSWPAAAPEVVGYRLYRSPAPFVSGAHIDGSLQIARETTLTAEVTSFSDANLQACESGNPRMYYYAVASVNCDETLFNEVGSAGYHYDSSAALSDYAVASGSPLARPLPAPSLDGSQAEEQRVLLALTNPLESASPDFDRTEVFWSKSTPSVSVDPPQLNGSSVVGGTHIPNRVDGGPEGVFTHRGSQMIVFDHESVADPALSLLPEQTYHFLAVSYDLCGNATAAPSVSFKIPVPKVCQDLPLGPPPAPTGGTITSCEPDTVSIGWTPVLVDDLAGFRVTRTGPGSAFKELALGSKSLKSWVDAGPLESGGEYTYWVIANDCVYEPYRLGTTVVWPYDPIADFPLYDNDPPYTGSYPPNTLQLGPVFPGGLRLYGVSSGDPAYFVTTESDGMDPDDPLTFTYHNNVKFWLQNSSGAEVTIERMSVTWKNPNVALSSVVIGGAPSITDQNEIFSGRAASGVEFTVNNNAVIEDTSSVVGGLSVVVPVRFRFTTTAGFVNRLVDMRREALRVSLWVKNSGFTAACSDPTQVTVEVPRGPELGFFSQSAPGRDGTDSYAVPGPVGTARDTDIKVSSGIGVNVYGTAVDHSGMLFPDGVHRGFAAAPSQLKVVGNSVAPAASSAVPIMPTSGTADFTLERIIGDSYALSWPLPPDPAELFTSAPGNVHWYFAFAVDKTGNWDRLPNYDYGNYAYAQTASSVCGHGPPGPPVLSGATLTEDNTGVILVWEPPTLYATDASPIPADDYLTYFVYYRADTADDDGGWKDDAPNGKNRSSPRYDHSGLTTGLTYRYKVHAKSSCIDCADIDCSFAVQNECCGAPSGELSSPPLP